MRNMGGTMEAASQPSVLLFLAAFLMGILGISVCKQFLPPSLSPFSIDPCMHDHGFKMPSDAGI
jgi:hypothetical protein